MNYTRNAYGELSPNNPEFEIWQSAKTLIKTASKKGKIPCAYDGLEWTGSRRRRHLEGTATHHEIYDIHPDPLRVLLCIRETEGSKYGVRTVSKTYYIIKKHGNGTIVKPAKKSIAARASKSADCELGCAIAVVEGKKKLKLPRACPDGIAYKMLAIGDDGRLYSIYDGSPWVIGTERHDKAMRDHNGGLYVYEEKSKARYAAYPENSVMADAPKVIMKCRVRGNYCRYGSKLAFSHVTPLNVEEIL